MVREDDRISVDETCRIAELFEYKKIPERDDILLNGEDTTCTHRVTDGDEVEPVPQIKRPPKPPKPLKPPKKAPVSAVVEDLVKEAQKEAEEPAEDPLLAPPKPLPSWAADLPFMTKNHATQEGPASVQNAVLQEEKPEPAVAEVPVVQAEPTRIKVEINGTPTLLPEKAKPVFVDLFDVYPIDLTKPGGKRMVSRLNGIDVIDFTMPLHEGDRVDLYWEK